MVFTRDGFVGCHIIGKHLFLERDSNQYVAILTFYRNRGTSFPERLVAFEIYIEIKKIE